MKILQISVFVFLSFQILFPEKVNGQNIILILSDDHRYDFMSFMEESPEFLETPNLDRLAREGAHSGQCIRYHISMFPQSCFHPYGTIYATSPGGG